jgi:integrase
LLSFAKYVGDIPLNSIVPRQVLSHLNGTQSSTATWRGKYLLLKNFFEYWAARGEGVTLPMPPIRPAEPPTFIPYIYSKRELCSLLRATGDCQKRDSCSIDGTTFRMVLLLLYGTGMLTGEAVRLARQDVDGRASFLTVRGGRFGRSRRIPIGPDLQHRVQRYMRRTNGRKNLTGNFFTNKDGSRIKPRVLGKCFVRLRRLAGVLRYDGASYQARMHDLRHTFAVHRITAWFKQDADMNRMLPALAAYMGQVGLGSAERYLSLTPERFRRELVKLSPTRRKKRWRDDPVLMKFLAEL